MACLDGSQRARSPDPDEAHRILNALAVDPRDSAESRPAVEALIVDALAWLDQGNASAAFLRADRVQRLLPTYGEPWLLKGRCLEAVGAPAEALACYIAALKVDPDLAPALEAVLRLHRESGDTELPAPALARYEESLRRLRAKGTVAAAARVAPPAGGAGRTPAPRPPNDSRVGADRPEDLDAVSLPLTDATVDIIIPVYRDYALTQACIASVLAAVSSTPMASSTARDIVVIDDATPEPELAAWLDRLARGKLITLLRNDVNRGFIRSVNRGLALHPGRDVVLLNADAQVNGDWLDRLRAAAYREPRVGTVTPLSNNGEHFGFPVPFDVAPMPQGPALARLHQAASRANDARSIAVPFGIGFCLYVRRACLAEVGHLDEAGLERGYGEEVDFCLRARAAGWEHRCALDTFVAHHGNVSFGAEKKRLVDENNRLIRTRYPEARRAYREFIHHDPIQAFRQAIERQLGPVDDAPRELVVRDVLRPAEGDLAACAGDPGRLFLQPCAHPRGNARLTASRPDGPQNLVYALPGDFEQLVADLVSFKVAGICYHDTAAQRPEILTLPERLGVPYELKPRDYSLYCPRRYLHAQERHCGDPQPIAACESCLAQHGSLLAEPSPLLLAEPSPLADYRSRMVAFVRGARRVQIADLSVARRFAQRFPGVAIEAPADTGAGDGARSEPRVAVARVPASRAAADRPAARRGSGATRIALVGPLLAPDGYGRLLRLARACAAEEAPVDFLILGTTLDDGPLHATGKAWATGKLAPDEDAASLARTCGAQLALDATAWPEVDGSRRARTLALGLPTLIWPWDGETASSPDELLARALA